MRPAYYVILARNGRELPERCLRINIARSQLLAVRLQDFLPFVTLIPTSTLTDTICVLAVLMSTARLIRRQLSCLPRVHNPEVVGSNPTPATIPI
jgi:hypothetical protein